MANLSLRTLVVIFALTSCSSAPPMRIMSVPHPEVPVCGCIMRSFEVHFSRNKTSLSDDDINYIAMAADYYVNQEIKPERVFVNGHADASEGDDDGQAISLSRAIEVEYQLIKDGVPGSKIVLNAYGDKEPMIRTGPGVPNAINRYVDITLD